MFPHRFEKLLALTIDLLFLGNRMLLFHVYLPLCREVRGYEAHLLVSLEDLGPVAYADTTPTALMEFPLLKQAANLPLYV